MRLLAHYYISIKGAFATVAVKKPVPGPIRETSSYTTRDAKSAKAARAVNIHIVTYIRMVKEDHTDPRNRSQRPVLPSHRKAS